MQSLWILPCIAALGLAWPALRAAPLRDKTLVAWVAPSNLTQRGGSVLTLDDARSHFDGMVFGELAAATWMAGSDTFQRTERNQARWPAETAGPTEIVQLAIVYRGNTVRILRNGSEVARHDIGAAHEFPESSVVIMGPRHDGNSDFFAGAIEDVRVYDVALSAEDVAGLRPNEAGATRPWAWWTFDDARATEKTGRMTGTRLVGGARVEGGRLILNGESAALFASADDALAGRMASRAEARSRATPPEEWVLNYHLMHPGGESLPGDPNAAFALDGTYHLHYILGHPWRGRGSFSFVHVTSPDMLHWTWQPTQLQPAFTGHGMFSGTGFLTADGRPAAIYHGESSGRNQIAIAKDRSLSGWEQPYPVDVRKADGSPEDIRHWDPDCFRIGDTYYAISGGENPPLLKSRDLRTWTRVGPFLQRDLPDVARGEDVSCANFFPIGGRWMLLCISHHLGCRYYIGDWDARAEQFVPARHGRMNWRREGQSLFGMGSWRVDFFAPESLLTPDGRRVMWAWLATVDRDDGAMSRLTLQSLPRELEVPADGILRIRPLRELETLRHDPMVMEDVELKDVSGDLRLDRIPPGRRLAELPGESVEVRITVPRAEAERKLFGWTMFADGKGGGLPLVVRPETGALRLGTTEAPFAVADLPPGEDLVLRVFIDRYLVEVFANDRQAMVASFPGYAGRTALNAFTVGAATRLAKVEVWKLKPTNQGFREAQVRRVWEPRRQ